VRPPTLQTLQELLLVTVFGRGTVPRQRKRCSNSQQQGLTLNRGENLQSTKIAEKSEKEKEAEKAKERFVLSIDIKNRTNDVTIGIPIGNYISQQAQD
jgi:hypothetical protein